MAKSKSATRKITPGEFLIHEESQLYVRESALIQNDSTTGAAAATDETVGKDPVGQPVKLNAGVWEFSSAANVTTGGAGNVDGFLLTNDVIEPLAADAFTDFEKAIVARGPAVINQGRIPAKDMYDAAIVEADYITAAEALDIEVKPLPPTTYEQTS